MSCLTPEGALSGDCDFLSANMYARSLFGVYPPATVFDVFFSTKYHRRGRAGQLEYRENGSWEHHWSCTDTKQNTGYRFVFRRPHHDISKGRKASRLMGWVDTNEYYAIDYGTSVLFVSMAWPGCPEGFGVETVAKGCFGDNRDGLQGQSRRASGPTVETSASLVAIAFAVPSGCSSFKRQASALDLDRHSAQVRFDSKTHFLPNVVYPVEGRQFRPPRFGWFGTPDTPFPFWSVR